MPARNKLQKYKPIKLKQSFKSIAKGKATIAEVAKDLKVHPSTVRYHVNAGTYA